MLCLVFIFFTVLHSSQSFTRTHMHAHLRFWLLLSFVSLTHTNTKKIYTFIHLIPVVFVVVVVVVAVVIVVVVVVFGGVTVLLRYWVSLRTMSPASTTTRLARLWVATLSRLLAGALRMGSITGRLPTAGTRTGVKRASFASSVVTMSAVLPAPAPPVVPMPSGFPRLPRFKFLFCFVFCSW